METSTGRVVRLARPPAAAVIALAILVCGGPAGQAGSVGDQVKPLSGKLTDRRGDVTSSAQLSRPPDLVGATIEVSQGTLTLTISFARGTLSPQTSVTVHLDTDENASTGEVTFRTDKAPIGADYVIRGLQPHDDRACRPDAGHRTQGGRRQVRGQTMV